MKTSTKTDEPAERSSGPRIGDPRFIQRLQQQNPEAFRVLLDEYDRKVFNIAYRMIPNREDVEDVAQEAFVEIWRALPRFRREAKLSTWIHRIAVNVCLEHRRRKRGAEDVSLEEFPGPFETPADGPQEQAERNDLQSRVHGCVSQLPAIYREVVVLHELQGFTYGEVARMLYWLTLKTPSYEQIWITGQFRLNYMLCGVDIPTIAALSKKPSHQSCRHETHRIYGSRNQTVIFGEHSS
jgi:RNA polymerase sigma-70 factor (ECF subfamily)